VRTVKPLLLGRAMVGKRLTARDRTGDRQQVVALLEHSVEQAKRLQLSELPGLESILDLLRAPGAG